MKSRRERIAYIIFAIFLFVFILVGSYLQDKVFSYDTTIAHPNIAELAAKLYNDKFDPDLTQEEIGWIKMGAMEEDTPTRWLNHFYDPIYKKGLTFGKEQYSAKDWIQNPKAQTNFSLGDQSWQRALSDYEKGDKQKSLKALGHVLHILADMTVPAHTREDIHVMPKDSYEDYVKKNWGDIYKRLNYTFISVDSLDKAVGDLANISNNNFYSDDTIEIKKYPIHHNLNKKEIIYQGIKYPVYELSIDNNEKYLLYFSQNVYSWQDALKNDNDNFSVNHSLILSDYSSILIPKAVGYSAGVIKLFFDEVGKNETVSGLPKFRTGLFGYIDTVVGNIIKGAEKTYDDINKFAEIHKPVPEVSARGSDSNVIPKVLGEKINAPTLITPTAPRSIPTPAVASNPPESSSAINELAPPLADSLEENFPILPAPIIPPSLFVTPIVVPYNGGGGGGGSSSGSSSNNNTNSNPESPPPSVPPVVPIIPVVPDVPPASEPASTTPTTTPVLPLLPPADTTPPDPPELASQFSNIIYTTSTSWTILGTCTTDTEKIISFRDNLEVDPINPQVINPEDYLRYWNYATPLNEGINNFSFVALDEAENRSITSTKAIIIRDTTSPTVPAITTTVLEENSSSTQIIVDLKSTDEDNNVFYDLFYQIKDVTTSDWVVVEENTTSSRFQVPTTRGKSYRFKAKAKDRLDNRSLWSEPIEVFVNWSGEVVINEIAGAGVPPDGPADEWFELYNNTDQPIDIKDWKIKVSACTVLPRYVRNTIIQPNSYLLFEHDRDRTIDEVDGDVMYWYGYCRFKNDGELVQLIKPDGTASDVVDASKGWFAGSNSGHYPSMERINPRGNGSDPGNWQNNQGPRETGKSRSYDVYGSPRRANFRFITLKETQTDNLVTLTKENSPYLLQAYVIPVGKTLRIGPGVVIKSYYNTAIIDVYGRLEIMGTENEPVIFTSGRDRNYAEDYLQVLVGNLGDSAPNPGDWQGLRFRNNSVAEINHAEFKYAGKSFISDNYQFAPAVRQIIRAERSSLNLVGANFHDSLGTTIYLKDATAVISSSSFKNGDQAIESWNSSLEVKNSSFSDYINQFWVYNQSGWPVLEDLSFATSSARVLLDISYVNKDVTVGGENNYYVVSNLEIQAGAKLTIKPGTTILLRGQGSITTKGSLMSLGLPGNPVTFKPYDASRWCFLNFVNSTSSLSYTRIEGGGCPNPSGSPSLEGMIRSDNSNLFFDNVTLWNTELRPPVMHMYQSSVFFKDSYIGVPTKYDNIWQQMPGILQWEGDLTLDNTTFENLNIAVNGHSINHELGTIFWKNTTPFNFKNVDIWSFPVGWGEVDLGI